MKGRALWAVATALIVSGCATPTLYQWGGYDDLMYRQYKDPSATVDVRTRLEEHVREMEAGGSRVAPGLYAEIGTLYLQAGDRDKALDMYRRERAVWPESRSLMDAMIGNLERQRASERTQ